jgi:predicted TIM-barrel fold metal-dependent hydrolase
MGRKYQIISGDGHVETPPDVWVKYVPEKWQERAPRLIRLPEGGDGWLIEGMPLMRNGQNITGRGPIRLGGASYFKPDGSAVEGAGNASQRLREQDEDGVDAEVLFPPVFASRFIEAIADRAVYNALIRAYNSFLAYDYCSVAPDRLIGNATLPISGIDAALDELEFSAKAGLRSVCFYQFPNGSGGPKPEDDRFWARSLELGMRLSPHFGFGTATAPHPRGGQDTSGVEFAAALAQRVGGQQPVYCMAQLICSGVLDRFPEIRFYFAETNAAWLPWVLFVLDDNYALFRDWYGAKLRMKPSEYVARHFYFGIVRDPVFVRVLDQIPVDNIMFGSDFPHSVGSYPSSRKFLDEAFAGVDPKVRRKVLLDTPAGFYGLDLKADITPTPEAR